MMGTPTLYDQYAHTYLLFTQSRPLAQFELNIVLDDLQYLACCLTLRYIKRSHILQYPTYKYMRLHVRQRRFQPL